MKIQMNQDAAKHFNEKIAAFLYELKPDKTQPRRNIGGQGSAQHARKSSASNVFVSGLLTEEHILKFSSLGYVDRVSGKQAGRFFPVSGTAIGLDREVYLEFEKVIERLHQKREINRFLSHDFLCDCAFEWFEKQYKGVIRDNRDWISFLAERAEESIEELKVSIPLSFLIVEKPFTVGSVLFEYFQPEFFDEYLNRVEKELKNRGTFDRAKFYTYQTRFRQKYQAAVFGSLTLEAEPKRCVEIAREEVDKALMVLRFFSPTVFSPKIPCCFGKMGHTHETVNHSFVFHNETPSIQEGFADGKEKRCDISARYLSQMRELGIETASSLIDQERHTAFEDGLLTSMFFFTRALTFAYFQDRIVYILASIETLLLRDQNEPIQSGIGLRLAFLTESDLERRKAVKQLITNAYKLRSSYIHHGKKGEDWMLLESLQYSVWMGINNALTNRDKFKTQGEFLSHIDNVIFQ